MESMHVNAVFSTPADGRELEYHEWYNELHLDDCVRGIEGYAAGRRFAIDPATGAGAAASWSHVALYELDASLADVFWSVEAFKARGAYEPPGGRVAPGLATWVYSRSDSGERSGSPLECAPGDWLCLCFSRPWHDWHEDRLCNEIAPQLPGFAGAWGYARGAQQRLGVTPPWELLTVYELEPRSARELVRVRSSAALGRDLASWVLAPVSPLVMRPAPAAG